MSPIQWAQESMTFCSARVIAFSRIGNTTVKVRSSHLPSPGTDLQVFRVMANNFSEFGENL